MLNLAMSRAASGLLRALFARAEGQRNRILLSGIRSVDWQSLTLTGERHSIAFRIIGPDAEAVAARFVEGLEEAEFTLCGHLLADIAVAGRPIRALDESVTLAIEALTIAD